MIDQKNTDSMIRQKEKQNVINALLRNNQNNTLNINGKWGCGKTYLSKLVQGSIKIKSE